MSSNPILPTIHQQFQQEYFDPTRAELLRIGGSIEIAYELAKEKYEQAHGHQYPHSFSTFKRHYYQQQR